MNKYFEKSYTDGFFNVNEKHGFLPIKDPIIKLGNPYEQIQSLIDDLHVFQDKNKGIYMNN